MDEVQTRKLPDADWQGDTAQMTIRPFYNYREGNPQEYYQRLLKRLEHELHETNDDACVEAYWHALQVLRQHPLGG